MAMCYMTLIVLDHPASAKIENITAVGFVLAPGGFAAVNHLLSCFT